MRYAPQSPFIHQEGIQAALTPKSSSREIQAVWEKYGYLKPNSMDKFNNGHFLRSVLSSITTEEQVLAFIDSLHVDAQKYTGLGSKCTKAQVALGALQSYHEARTLRGAEWSTNIETILADLPRRTCCHCHETGSYYPRQK